MNNELVRRRFTMADQRAFAAATGDRNPIHLDALAARRTQAGAPVVHGVQALLWALDALASNGELRPFARLTVRFNHFAYVDEELALRVVPRAGGSQRAELLSRGSVGTTVDLHAAGAAAPAALAEPPSGPVLETLAEPGLHDLVTVAHARGRLAVHEGVLAPRFPALTARIGALRVEALGQLSYLVGMVCPGLHSLFAGLDVSFADDADPTGGIAFEVASADERFRLVDMQVRGSGIAGSVSAFLRPPPIEGPPLDAVRRVVAHDEFHGASALIVGGSRGLGAVTARILAAGGARTIVTYNVGAADALGLSTELGAERCAALRYDVRADAAAQLAQLPWEIGEVYYFASPSIFRHQAAAFDAGRWQEFMDVYVLGFERLLAGASACGAHRLRVFYPSSVAVAERPRGMTEYAMAKAAGEILCADLNRFDRGRIVVERLPRVLTDQTATVMPTESADALDVMLPIVRRVQARSEGDLIPR